MRVSWLRIWGFVGALLVTATSWSDTSPTPTLPPTTSAVTEPITGTPAQSIPGNEVPPKDPFSPYGTGPGIPLPNGPQTMPSKPFWSNSDLNAAEQAVAQRGVDTSAWAPTHNAFASAARELAQVAAANAAANDLGVESLASTGVVP
jgi:hypothetical protein